ALMTFAPIYFAFDKSVLTQTATDTLDAVVRFMNANPNAKIEVVGYTDNFGPNEYNTRLGARRAIAARDYIISKGIAGSRITTVTRGEDDPAADNTTAAGRAKNRRAVAVEIR
ncbi:MAG: OmpA family protein, partial [Gemmatimonadetes bacterium]|nr:OmpA family protein [Gemmatimonadota bacterium]